IQPVAWPTSQQISTAKTKTQYTEGAFHIAVAGSSGSGKSSLINAFRGLSNRDNRAAPTGFVETTRVIGRYEDPDPKRPLVWYDMPSIGTLEVPDSQHFNEEGLFVFDCVVVLFDHRLTEQDVALLRYCAHFQIPSYIVRSKSDAQIGAIEREMRVANADDEGEEEDGLEAVHVSRIGEYEEARGRYMRETNESVHRTLAQAGLPVQTVYFVARNTLRKVIKESL
ncbi:interferon-inducible GTPase-domain-containing protein, partial [Sparassis latifolia]